MPEAPELEVVREFLAERIVGESIARAQVIKPSVLRPLAAPLVPDVVGRSRDRPGAPGQVPPLRPVRRPDAGGEPHADGGVPVLSPVGAHLQEDLPALRASRTGRQLRYLDDKQMGRVYYISGSQIGEVPQLATQGPDVLAPMDLEEFRERLGKFRGEIKGVLTRGRVVSGIGNAYADEVLFEAKIYPYRKCGQLSEDELRRLHAAVPERARGRGALRAGAHGRPHPRQEPRLPEGTQQGRRVHAPAAATRSARSPPTGASPATAAGVSRGCS